MSGPNLFEPGEAFGALLHLPTLTGAFAFTVAAQLLAALVFYTGLRVTPPVKGPYRSKTPASPPNLIRAPRSFAVFPPLVTP